MAACRRRPQLEKSRERGPNYYHYYCDCCRDIVNQFEEAIYADYYRRAVESAEGTFAFSAPQKTGTSSHFYCCVACKLFENHAFCLFRLFNRVH